MTAEEAIARIQDHISTHGIGEYPHSRLGEALEMAVAALRTTTVSGPLTLEQLKSMRNQVVFVDITVKEFSRICDLKSQFGIVRPEENKIHLFNGRSLYFTSRGSWTAYAYPTARIDREAWTAEWKRQYKSGTSAGPGYVCSACDMWHERPSWFCPACGRAMTPESMAWLEKRLQEVTTFAK